MNLMHWKLSFVPIYKEDQQKLFICHVIVSSQVDERVNFLRTKERIPFFSSFSVVFLGGRGILSIVMNTALWRTPAADMPYFVTNSIQHNKLPPKSRFISVCLENIGLRQTYLLRSRKLLGLTCKI